MYGRKVLMIWITLLAFAALWVTPAFAECTSDSGDSGGTECTDGNSGDSGEVIDGDTGSVDDGSGDDGYVDDGSADDGYIDEGEYTDGDDGSVDDGSGDDGYIDEGEYTDGEYTDGDDGTGDDGYVDEGEYTDGDTTDGDYEDYEVIDPYPGDGEIGIFYINGGTEELGDGTDNAYSDTDVEAYGAAANSTATGGSTHHTNNSAVAHTAAPMAHQRLNAADLAAPVALFCGANSSIEVWDIGTDGQGTLAFTLPVMNLLDGEIGLGLGNQLSLLEGGQAELLTVDSPSAYAFSFDPLVCAGI